MCLKLKVVIILSLIILNSVLCQHKLLPFDDDQNITIISKVLYDIVNEYFIKEDIKFEVIIVNNITVVALDLVNDFLRHFQSESDYLLQYHNIPRKKPKTIQLDSSAMFFLSSITEINLFIDCYLSVRNGNNPIVYIVYVQNLTYEMLEKSGLLNVARELDYYVNYAYFYVFFIIDEPDSVVIATVEWFNQDRCNEAHFSKVNDFDKESRMWLKEFKYYEKFLEYYGCNLKLLVPLAVNGIAIYPSLYGIIYENGTLVYIGIAKKVYEIASGYYNFSVSYGIARCTRDFILEPLWNSGKDSCVYPRTNGVYEIPNIFFYVGSSFRIPEVSKLIGTSNVFVDISYVIAVTPSMPYTPYEKFFLPFDLETWILLIITFSIAFLSIIIINRLSISTQRIVYGHNVETPIWNVIRIFFGISQTQLPKKSFSRILLILFIFFCLIFRTCYQSKFFEFMTSEPRRPPPKTIEDLIDKNYTIFTVAERNEDVHLKFVDDRGRRAQTKTIFAREFDKLFTKQSMNASAKVALIVDELVRNHIEKVKRENFNWNQLTQTFLTSYESFQFLEFMFYFRMLRKMINRLIDTGVIIHLSNTYYTRRLFFKKDPVKPMAFRFDDMVVGFNVWLGSCSIAILAFLVEILMVVALNIALKFCKRKRRYQRIISLIKYVLPTRCKAEKFKFAKVCPTGTDECGYSCKLKAETIKIFRVKTKTPKNEEVKKCGGSQVVVVAEIHHFDKPKQEESQSELEGSAGSVLNMMTKES